MIAEARSGTILLEETGLPMAVSRGDLTLLHNAISKKVYGEHRFGHSYSMLSLKKSAEAIDPATAQYKR